MYFLCIPNYLVLQSALSSVSKSHCRRLSPASAWTLLLSVSTAVGDCAVSLSGRENVLDGGDCAVSLSGRDGVSLSGSDDGDPVAMECMMIVYEVLLGMITTQSWVLGGALESFLTIRAGGALSVHLSLYIVTTGPIVTHIQAGEPGTIFVGCYSTTNSI